MGFLAKKNYYTSKIISTSMSPDTETPPKKQIVGCEGFSSRGGIARNIQFFHNNSALWEDISHHFNIIDDTPQIYARDCNEKGILCVKKYESVRRGIKS